MQAALFGSKAFGIAGSLSLDVLESGSWAITVQVVGRKMLSPGLSCSLLWSKHRRSRSNRAAFFGAELHNTSIHGKK